MKRILEYSNVKARRYFLKEASYYNFDLPKYFLFQPIIEKVSKEFKGKNLLDFCGNYPPTVTDPSKKTLPSDFENVNYKFLNNKDGKFAWRPFQLIHPVLYVSLVHKITEKDNWELIVERFKKFEKNPLIKCISIPIESKSNKSDKAETIINWWNEIEQQPIELALDYEYVLHTDITDCYGSIYTHSIVWALHTKKVGKAERDKKSLIGNIIDKHLQGMSYGQTNGIPQGSALMDFIAEMVLGYVDFKLSISLKKAKNLGKYKIIRYRDDYRVFSNNPQDADFIVKNLTEILIDLGMRLSSQKTLVSNNIVRSSIKPDKIYWITNNKETSSLQANLLLIHELSQHFHNSGSLSKALDQFYNRIEHINKAHNIPVLISILVDIAYKNPRIYPIATAILSKLLSLIGDNVIQDKILNSIITRFGKIPNTGHLQIWLQRVTIKIDRQKHFNELLCKKVNDSTIQIWNSDWLNDEMKLLINSEPHIDEQIIKKINKVIEPKEVQLFNSKTDYDGYNE